jgi:hypothetical protein
VSRAIGELTVGFPSLSKPFQLVFAGMTQMAADRQQQPHLRENENTEHRSDRFLDLEMFTAAPMSRNLTSLPVEYAIALIHSTESGRRNATVRFVLGPNLPEPGLRGELALQFDVKPAIAELE